MDERYDPAFQRGSGGEPGEQPGRTVGTPAGGASRRHPIHDDNHRRSLGSSRVHGETAGSMRRGTTAESVGTTADQHADRTASPTGQQPGGSASSTGQHPGGSASPTRQHPGQTASPTGQRTDRATDDAGAAADAADGTDGIDIFRSIGAIPQSPADVDAETLRRAGWTGADTSTSATAGADVTSNTNAGAGITSEPEDQLLLDEHGEYLDAPPARSRRNPWEGALWFIGVALSVIGSSALWQSFQMLSRSYSWDDGPPPDYSAYQFASAIAPGFLTLGIATIIGLLFARMLRTERKARA